MRPVTVLAAGGTIAMAGDRAAGARPKLDAAAIVSAVPALRAVEDLAARTVADVPSVQLGGDDALRIAGLATREAAAGRGVVVTHGTDVLEEVALLCDLIHGGEAPVVFTGAMRPADAPGADGPANLADAVAVAGVTATAGLGVLVCFAGEMHAARDARKVDSTGPRAFASPRAGPVGYVAEGRVEVARRVDRRPPLDVRHMDARVHAINAGLGTDGALVEAAAARADGLVVVLLGAGHTPPAFLAAVERAAATLPVVATVRPERGAILRGTYGFPGSERDLRATPVVCAAALSPAAARVKLMACLGAGLDRDGIAAAFAPEDA